LKRPCITDYKAAVNGEKYPLKGLKLSYDHMLFYALEYIQHIIIIYPRFPAGESKSYSQAIDQNRFGVLPKIETMMDDLGEIKYLVRCIVKSDYRQYR
jgi:hypothetical protein